jgi:hypothetical protein
VPEPSNRPATPLLRQVFDSVEREVAPRLEQLVRTEQFAIAVGLLSRLQQAAQAQARRNTRRVLHLMNLPAGTDVARILGELGQLKQQVRDLSDQLEAKEAELDAVTAGSRRAARSRSA